jgi:hypothetical protein
MPAEIAAGVRELVCVLVRPDRGVRDTASNKLIGRRQRAFIETRGA